MKKSIVLFFIAVVISGYANEKAQSLEAITTAKRMLKMQTEILEHSAFLPINYVVNLITMNKQNLALVKYDIIQPSLELLDWYLEEAIDALKELNKAPIANNNHLVTPREKIKFFEAMRNANAELEVIDDLLHIPKYITA